MFRFFLFFFILIIAVSCADRNAPNQPQTVFQPDNNTVNELDLIGPYETGINFEFGDSTYKDAIFLDIKTEDVWAIYKVVNGENIRVNWELDFEKSFDYMFHTDKYTDEQGKRHFGVYCQLPQPENNRIRNIKLAVPRNNRDPLSGENFSVIAPSKFGKIVETSHGNFIEAEFTGYETQEVWAVFKSFEDGLRHKVGLARRFNKPLFVYIKQTYISGTAGNQIPQVLVGLPYEPALPVQKIEIVVEK